MSTETPDRKALLREALRTVEDMQKRLEASERAKREPIAVVGVGCRLPGAEDPDALWRVLDGGVDAIREVPADRWDPDSLDVSDAGERGRTAARLGGYLERVDLFDAAFFGISPREAASLDPQQRLLLEVAWETLENSGQAPDGLVGSSTGVFVGITTLDYAKVVGVGQGGQTDVYAATGNALNAAAGRLSFVLGLQGPCVSVDTACSSSLTAVHLACQSLRGGECDLALAAGVNVILSPDAALLFARWGMLAADGRCKTFDASADGFIRAEGCGMLALKRLSSALENGDHVLALLLGSAVNQDGASSGLTVPNGPAQQAVLRRALASAGVSPAEVDYVEAHGTGTPIGDPIEVEALAAVMGPGRPAGHPLALGSIKANIGHAEAASGVAGLLKVILSLDHEALPAHLHLKELNPRLAWGDALTVHSSQVPWPRGDRRRIAGVSSFGFSGTNAHVVVAEAPAPAPVAAESGARPLHLLPLSARSEGALRAGAARLASRLAVEPPPRLEDVAYTLGTGRAALSHRAAIVARDAGEARRRLEALAENAEAPGLRRGLLRPGSRPRVAFLFTGQGSQQAGMGRGLYDSEPVFRRALDRCDEALRSHRERPLLDVVFGAAGTEGWLDQTAWTQPALFALEWAMAELLGSWGIVPDAVLGHSIGELAAACVAGVMSPEDGLLLAAERGRLMQALPTGEMLAVSAPEGRVARHLEAWRASVSIAALNGPESVVVSGEPEAIREVRARLEADGLRCEPLRVSHAFHSPMMDPMLDALERHAASIRHADPRLDLVSNLTGDIATPGSLGASYWRRHARGAVRFEASLRTLQSRGCDILVEVGPHATLLGLARQTVEQAAFVPCLRRGQQEWDTLLDALGALFVHGVVVDWTAFHRDRPRRRLALPTYAFQRERCWVASDARLRSSRPTGTTHPFLATRMDLANAPGTHVWEGEVSIAAFPYLRDHRVQHGAVVPATAWTEMGLEAFTEAHGAGPVALEGLEYLKPLFLGEDDRNRIQVSLTGSEAGAVFEVSSRRISELPSIEPWIRHATGRIRRCDGPASPAPLPGIDEIRRACPQEIAGDEFYRLLRERGNDWGPAFQGLQRLWRGTGEAWSVVRAPEGPGMALAGYEYHPALADAAGHVLVGAAPLAGGDNRRGGAFVGGGIDEIRLYRKPVGRSVTAHARLRPEDAADTNLLIGDVRVFDEEANLVSELRGARLWYLDDDATRLRRGDGGDRLFEVAWRPLERPDRPSPEALSGVWVVVAGDPLAAALSKRLAAVGAECRPVKPGGRDFERRMVTALSGEGVRGVVCQVVGGRPEESGRDGLTTASGLLLVLAVLRSLLNVHADAPPRLWIATSGAQPVGGAPPNPLAAAVWGLGRSLALEHPDTWGGLVDLDPEATAEASAEALVARLQPVDGEDQVAFRSAQAFAPRLVHSRARGRGPGVTLRPDATYLVTGGRGGLGLEVARSLAERGARRLVLLGRTPLPPRHEWAALAGNEDAPAQVVAALRRIEAQGASVLTASVDVGDRAQLTAWYEAFRREAWPPLRGVVHAAGVLGHRAAAEEEEGSLEAALAAKVRGAWLLHEVLAGETLDLFVLFSSASAILSSPRLGAYAAANAVLDALAHHLRSLGRPALSIDWGVWGEAGMVTRFQAADVSALVQRGMGALTTEEGLEAMWRLIDRDLPHAAVLPVDWAEWARRYPALSGAPFLREVAVAAEGAPLEAGPEASERESILAAPPPEREGRLAAFLAVQVARVMQLQPDALDREQPLRTLGLDSLMAVEIRNRVQGGLGVSLPLAVLLEGPSVAQLAVRLLPMLSSAPMSAAAKDEPGIDSRKAAVLLESLDELGEGDVDALLGQMLAEGSASKGETS